MKLPKHPRRGGDSAANFCPCRSRRGSPAVTAASDQPREDGIAPPPGRGARDRSNRTMRRVIEVADRSELGVCRRTQHVRTRKMTRVFAAPRSQRVYSVGRTETNTLAASEDFTVD